jgi:hypothetical protein
MNYSNNSPPTASYISILMYKYDTVMSTTIRIAPGAVWTNPDIEGLEVSDGEWRLDVARYQDFLRVTTGISPVDGLSTSDCYRIGNRLQALIEERKRQDEWDSALVESYPDVESLEALLWVARFFRACQDCHDASEICFSGCEPDDSCA